MQLDVENVAPSLPAAGKGKVTKSKAQPLGASTSHNAEPGKSIEEIYQKKSQLEHILLRPDTYIGSTEKQQQSMWIYDEGKIVQKTIDYVPGLYKIFDEILVNAADNKVRDASMDTLKVVIDPEANKISVWNNGAGVPVEVHKEEGVYVPELIFGHLLTSSNYNDNEKKVTGGRNGYGAKLANIFSTEFVVETADGSRQKKYFQKFNDNMTKKGQPKITAGKASDNYTCISFKPDLAKFGMDHLEADTVALMTKRVYDMAGLLGKTVKVYLNNQRIGVKSFQDYVDLYLGPKDSGAARVYERFSDRWEICISPTEGQFQQVSFVNSICTYKGGTHVNYIVDQITKHLVEKANKKNKNANVKPFMVKNHLWVFINAQVENPAFDSQTKENLTLKASSFGSKCDLPTTFVDKVGKAGVLDNILSYASFRNDKELKKSDGAKRSRLIGVSKLEDANDAGGKNSQKCTLILTEGDSAKTLAITGLGVVGRDHYGVFPLRGKLLNVREASAAQVSGNTEIQHIKQILGLQHGKQYDDVKQLRYGHLMIMTDQDHDGSHIKGLIMNFLHTFYPSLLKIPGFLVEFITPIVKATNGKRTMTFYTMPEYEAWKEAANPGKSWDIKYYKGLGTSTDEEAREYFSNLGRHRKEFVWEGHTDAEAIEMAFSKKKVEDRKKWLSNYVPGTFLDHSAEEISYSEFINKELILFSRADLERSIPSMVDGLKPGQRKIIFASFKRNLKKDIKVAQLSGYVSEHCAYHHGETSLQSTIVNLAQNFVGSNNINLLYPAGQFGSRLQGGKDHASPRYIFTRLATLTRHLFNEADDKLLNYLNEEGQSIEPEWYMPIMPTVLVNGAEGIGTGWSTYIPNYNPKDIADNLKRLINGEPMVPMQPWYRGFHGTIEEVPSKTAGKTYSCCGIIRKTSDTTLEITELPIRKWTQDYKEYLESLIKPEDKNVTPTIVEYKEHHSNVKVHFILELTPEKMAEVEATGLEKEFKLTTKISTGNMMLFDPSGVIKRYESPEQILQEFFTLRVDYYEKRRLSLLRSAEAEMRVYDNKVRFILAVVEGRLKVQNRKRADVEADLDRMGFDRLPNKARQTAEVALDEDSEDGPSDAAGYQYLLSMAINSLTYEKVEKLKEEFAKQQESVEILKRTTCKDMWLQDLDSFIEAFDTWEAEEEVKRSEMQKQAAKSKAQAARKAPAKPRKKLTALHSDDNSDGDDGSDEEFIVSKGKKASGATRAPAAKAAPSRATSQTAAAKKAAPAPAPAHTSASQQPAASTSAAETSTQPATSEDTQQSLGARLAGRMASLNLQAAGSKPATSRGGKKAQPEPAAPVVDLADSDGELEVNSPVPAPKPAAKKTLARKAPAAKATAKGTAASSSQAEPKAAPKRKPRGKVVISEDEASDSSDNEDAFEIDAPSPAVAHQGKVRRTGPSPFHKKKTAGSQSSAVADSSTAGPSATEVPAVPAVASRPQRARAPARQIIEISDSDDESDAESDDSDYNDESD